MHAASGLVEQPQTFYAWNSGADDDGDEPLRLSADAQLHRLIGSRYVPAQNAPQMDLFFDNPVVALTNGIVRALSARNLAMTQRQLDRLYAQRPTMPISPLSIGCWPHWVTWTGPSMIRGRNSSFVLDITPAARRLLGWEARDLLGPLWRQLADALWSQAFSKGDNPNLHRSCALIPGAGLGRRR